MEWIPRSLARAVRARSLTLQDLPGAPQPVYNGAL